MQKLSLADIVLLKAPHSKNFHQVVVCPKERDEKEQRQGAAKQEKADLEYWNEIGD